MRGRRHRGGGAAGRAELHQAVPPRFNIRLRDDKSYPFIAISLDENFPRVYFTRERHRGDRAYFGPYSNAKRVRATLEVLAKVFMFRSCTGPEPGGAAATPAWTTTSSAARPLRRLRLREDYRESIDGVMDFLSGRFAGSSATSSARMLEAAAARTLRAGHARAQPPAGRSLAARAPAGGGRARGHLRRGRRGARRPATPTPRSSRSATAILSDRQSFYLENATEREPAEVGEEFMLQYYGGGAAIPALLVVPEELGRPRGAARRARQPPRGPVEMRVAERGEKRRILELAERNARARPRPGATERGAPPPDAGGGAGGPAAGARPRRSADPDRVLRHLQPRRHPHGRLDGRVRGRRAEEVRLPPLHDPHRRGLLRRLCRDGGGALAALRAVAGQPRSRPTTRPTTRASPRSPTSS